MKLASLVLSFINIFVLAAPVFAQNKKPAGNGNKKPAAAQPNGGAAPAAPQDIANQLDILRKRAQELIDKAAANKSSGQDEGAKAQLRGVVNEINNWTHEAEAALQRKAAAPAKGQPAAKADYKEHALAPLANPGDEGASWRLEQAAAQSRADEAGLLADLLRLHVSGADAAAMKAKHDALDKVVSHRKDAQARMERAAAAAKERAAKAPPKE